MQTSATCFSHGTWPIGSKHSCIFINSINVNQNKLIASVMGPNCAHEKRKRNLTAVTCAKGRAGRGKALLQGKLRAPADDPELIKVEKKLGSVEVCVCVCVCVSRNA